VLFSNRLDPFFLFDLNTPGLKISASAGGRYKRKSGGKKKKFRTTFSSPKGGGPKPPPENQERLVCVPGQRTTGDHPKPLLLRVTSPSLPPPLSQAQVRGGGGSPLPPIGRPCPLAGEENRKVGFAFSSALSGLDPSGTSRAKSRLTSCKPKADKKQTAGPIRPIAWFSRPKPGEKPISIFFGIKTVALPMIFGRLFQASIHQAPAGEKSGLPPVNLSF